MKDYTDAPWLVCGATVAIQCAKCNVKDCHMRIKDEAK